MDVIWNWQSSRTNCVTRSRLKQTFLDISSSAPSSCRIINASRLMQDHLHIQIVLIAIFHIFFVAHMNILFIIKVKTLPHQMII